MNTPFAAAEVVFVFVERQVWRMYGT